jgi:hypothetical protein
MGTTKHDTVLELNKPEMPSTNGDVPVLDFTTLDDFFDAVRPTQETLVIGNRRLYFEAGSPADKDKLFEVHRRDDGMGNISIENKRWRINVIALAWVKAFGGPRVLASPDDADRFYHHKGFASIEMDMFLVALRVNGLGEEAEKRRKNSGAAATT